MLLNWNDFGFGDWDRAARDFDVLRREMDRVFADFGRGPGRRVAGRVTWPQVQLADTGAALVLRAEVPGLTERDIEIQLDQSTLTLHGARAVAEREGYDTHRRERTAYDFARSFTLPVKVDAERAKAVLEHGVLTLTLPKAPELQPRQIPVTAAN